MPWGAEAEAVEAAASDSVDKEWRYRRPKVLVVGG